MGGQYPLEGKEYHAWDEYTAYSNVVVVPNSFATSLTSEPEGIISAPLGWEPDVYKWLASRLGSPLQSTIE
jgi:hypothetical protein